MRLVNRTDMCDRRSTMTGHEFEARVRKLGRARGVAVLFDKGHGKGSHGRLYFGDQFTTLKDRAESTPAAKGSVRIREPRLSSSAPQTTSKQLSPPRIR